MAAAIGLYLARDLVTQGLALDGLVYANLAKLLAQDVGGFWSLPRYDVSAGAFHEHPPLGIWLLGQWMRLVGDAFWAEKAFAALSTTGCLGLTALLWRELGGGRAVWWPWLLLASMPVATYTLKNNYLESTLVLVALLAVWSSARLVAAARARRSVAWLWAVAVAGGVLAALLIKGPAGLFPLAAPGLFALAGPPLGSAAWSIPALRWGLGWTLVVLTILVLASGLLLLQPEAREALAVWWRTQVLASIGGTRPVLHGRLYQLGQLTGNLLGPLLLVTLAWWRGPRRPPSPSAVAILLLALAASLPLLLSARHFKHYLLPALPLFAIGLGLLARPGARWPVSPVLTWGAAVLLAAVAVARGVWYFGTVGNDSTELRAAARVADTVPAEAVVAVCPAAAEDDALLAYLYRQHDLRHRIGDTDAAWVLCRGADDSALDLGGGWVLRQR